MDKYEKAIMLLCENLDLAVYLPVKKELQGYEGTYSLGNRKENFKGLIEETINGLKGGKE